MSEQRLIANGKTLIKFCETAIRASHRSQSVTHLASRYMAQETLRDLGKSAYIDLGPKPEIVESQPKPCAVNTPESIKPGSVKACLLEYIIQANREVMIPELVERFAYRRDTITRSLGVLCNMGKLTVRTDPKLNGSNEPRSYYSART